MTDVQKLAMDKLFHSHSINSLPANVLEAECKVFNDFLEKVNYEPLKFEIELFLDAVKNPAELSTEYKTIQGSLLNTAEAYNKGEVNIDRLFKECSKAYRLDNGPISPPSKYELVNTSLHYNVPSLFKILCEQDLSQFDRDEIEVRLILASENLELIDYWFKEKNQLGQGLSFQKIVDESIGVKNIEVISRIHDILNDNTGTPKQWGCLIVDALTYGNIPLARWIETNKKYKVTDTMVLTKKHAYMLDSKCFEYLHENYKFLLLRKFILRSCKRAVHFDPELAVTIRKYYPDIGDWINDAFIEKCIKRMRLSVEALETLVGDRFHKFLTYQVFFNAVSSGTVLLNAEKSNSVKSKIGTECLNTTRELLKCAPKKKEIYDKLCESEYSFCGMAMPILFLIGLYDAIVIE